VSAPSTSEARVQPQGRPPRRGYVDWLRGLAVVIMIEAHTIDSWTAAPWRTIDAYWYGQLIAGMSAPLFLFLAGVSVSMASGSRVRRGSGVPEAAAMMIRRGGWIFLLALLFRIQSFVVSPGSSFYGILKVDILNVMGPAISGAALVWGLAKRRLPQIIALAAIACAISLVTPFVRSAGWLTLLPNVLEAYLRPQPGRTSFSFFPWTGFVFAGAALGVVLDAIRHERAERRLQWWFVGVGLTIASLALAASYLPSPYRESYFWTSSPSFFFLRIGLIVASFAVAYAWEHRPTGARFSPLQQFGRTSLFVYWIHVELVYGFISTPLHRRLSLIQWAIAYVLFTVLMFSASMWWTRRAARKAAAPDLLPAATAAR
jgi:uncharacterized membrane protein